jgi:diaminohydroxyphosphoribosylaminopyrimidine deaminase/5-amino-6-(5-phosphoribosylamino)uracil reductase
LTRELAWGIATGGPWPAPESLTGDERAMAEALQEGLNGIGISSPNPSVGCVLVRDGRIIGRGAHKRAGGPHAEVAAMHDAEQKGEAVEGATAYVTLEPCRHFGRTPPCTDALLRGRIRRVVVGVRDRDPRVVGGGAAELAANGVEVVEGVLVHACAALHAPFFKLANTGLPWVTLKLAIGADNGVGPTDKKTIVTALETQMLAHALRRASDGIMVGRNTIEVDDPQLTDRWFVPPEPHRVFKRIVLDSRGTLGSAHRVWHAEEGHSTHRALAEDAPKIEGVEDLRIPPGAGGCSLRHLLHELALKGICRLLVEGGPTLAEQLLKEGLVDVLHVFRSDRPIGGRMVELGAQTLGRVIRCARFDGGTWERGLF